MEADNDGAVVRLVRRQHRVLLGVLALEAEREVTADRLVELLWGDRPPRSARAVLHSRMSELRAVLTWSVDGVPRPLGTVRDGYVLELDRSRVDAHVFLGLAGGTPAGMPPAEARDRLRRALDLWRGPVLGGWSPGEPHAALCQELEAVRLTAVERRFDLELELGDMRAVADELLALSTANPGRERLAAQAMTALSASDRTAEAIGVYDRCRRWLADELGLDPGGELQQLNLKLLRGHAVGTPRAAPAGPPVSQLPTDVMHFVGRHHNMTEIEEVLGSAAGGVPPLVAISGPPGVGKTALAVHLGKRLQHAYPDGQLFVNLRGYSPERPLSAEEVLHQFLRAHGVRPEQIPTGRDELSALFRSALAGRRVLVVLDNAGSAEQVRPLLPGSAGCAAIVTSRDRLLGLTALDGAREVTVGMLSSSEARRLLTAFIGADRVGAEPVAADELARLCGHLPLAVRIAAAQLTARPGRTIAAFVEHLETRTMLGELAIDGDDGVAVRSAIELSYQHLDAGTAAGFRLLGSAPGPDFDPYATAALTGLPLEDAHHLIERLVGRSLVEVHGRDRYHFHDLIRDFAQSKAIEKDDAATRAGALNRLFDYYQAVAVMADAVLYPDVARWAEPPPVDGTALPPVTAPPAALAWLDAELPNLAAAVGDRPSPTGHLPVWLLADAMYGYLSRQRHTTLGLRIYGSALAAATAAGHSRARAEMHCGLANFSFQDARSEPARSHFGTALELFGRLGDAGGEARCHHGLGVTAAALGDYADAAGQFRRARELLLITGAAHQVPGVECNLGNMYGNAGDLPAALSWLTSARDGAERLGLRYVVARACTGAAFIHSLHGDLDLAGADLEQALKLWADLRNEGGQAEALRFLAAIRLDRGLPGEARDLAERSWRQAEVSGDPWMIMGARLVLGDALLALGHVDQAADHFQDLRDGEPDGWRQYRNWATVGLASCRRAEGDLSAAEALAREAAADRRPYIGALAALELARVGEAGGEWHTAAEQAERAARTGCEHGFRLVEARALALLGLARFRDGDRSTAQTIRGRALTVLADLGASEGAGSALRPAGAVTSSPRTCSA